MTWPRVNTLLLTLVLLAVLSLIGMMAMRAEGGALDPSAPPGPTDSVRLPGAPIAGPTTISAPGHYYLTRDITVSGGTAIAIAASDVTLDLGGFTISGTDSVLSNGIRVNQFMSPISISNGYIRDFDTGINSIGSHLRIENVHVFSNRNGFIVGNHSEISDCTVALNTLQGIILAGSMSRVQNCTIVDNSGSGVYIQGFDNVIERSHFARNNTLLTSGNAEIRFGGNSFRVVIRDSVIGLTSNTGFPIAHDGTNLSYALINNAMCGLPPVHSFVVQSNNVGGAWCQ